jgi:5'-3' exonuclease
MKKYILVDFANTFFRARHVAARQTDPWTKLGFAIHLTLASIHKAYKDFGADHVVICKEGRSWRKDFYEPYKKNRAVARAALTEDQQEEDAMFWQAFDDFGNFMEQRTSCSVLRCETAEADDLIARWIQTHPNDSHVIISSDSDFYQLITEKVTQFNGISNEHYTLDGVFNDKGKPVIDKKTKEQKQIGDPKWLLFEKCIRGDSSDNVFSAYPGARSKGTKNKIGMQEAFGDKGNRGFNWNNFMLQRWVDHNGEEHRVLDDYQRNVTLIDLTAQPQEIKDKVDDVIRSAVKTTPPSQIGTHFMKFCGKYEMTRIGDQASAYADWLKKEYNGELLREFAS